MYTFILYCGRERVCLALTDTLQTDRVVFVFNSSRDVLKKLQVADDETIVKLPRSYIIIILLS